MDKEAIKSIVYGGLEEILNNKQFYYHSTVGQPYSHLTDDGKEVVTEFIEVMAWKMKEAEEAELNRRSKEMVIKGLKGESLSRD